MRRAMSIWTVVFAVLSTWLIEMFGAAIVGSGHLMRGRLGEVLGGFVGGLMVAGPAFLVYMAVMLPIDRHFGFRCPHCGRSLTLRCLHQRVLQTGECSLCHAKVFD